MLKETDHPAVFVDVQAYSSLATPRYVSHKLRPNGVQCSDHTRWLVLEESPSFYITWLPGEAVSLKRKTDYAVVNDDGR